MQLSIIVPTFNEAPNVAELVRRVAAETQGIDAEIIFVDDSTDATPDVIREVATSAAVPVLLIHRETGGHSTNLQDATAILEFVIEKARKASAGAPTRPEPGITAAP